MTVAAASGGDGADGPELADDVVRTVTAIPGVAGMHGGLFGEVGTYLPGRKVAGVRETSQTVEVHVAVDWGVELARIADAVRVAVAKLPGVAGRAVAVYVEDIAERSDQEVS